MVNGILKLEPKHLDTLTFLMVNGPGNSAVKDDFYMQLFEHGYIVEIADMNKDGDLLAITSRGREATLRHYECKNVDQFLETFEYIREFANHPQSGTVKSLLAKNAYSQIRILAKSLDLDQVIRIRRRIIEDEFERQRKECQAELEEKLGWPKPGERRRSGLFIKVRRENQDGCRKLEWQIGRALVEVRFPTFMVEYRPEAKQKDKTNANQEPQA